MGGGGGGERPINDPGVYTARVGILPKSEYTVQYSTSTRYWYRDQ